VITARDPLLHEGERDGVHQPAAGIVYGHGGGLSLA
jgi:hypothetical protein